MALTNRSVGSRSEYRSASRYTFARGLDYLRRCSEEHDLLASRLTLAWRPTLARADGALRLCDFGTGFGDLAASLLECVGTPESRPNLRFIDVVDRDQRLAAYTQRRLSDVPRTVARVRTPDELLRSSAQYRYDCILSAHVLYYVTERAAVVAALADRLRPCGSLTIVQRSALCDAFAIRSALRELEDTYWQSHPSRPRRITDETITDVLRDKRLDVSVATVECEVRVPAVEVRISDLYTEDCPSTDATEFIRFLGHVDPNATSERWRIDALIDQLRARRDGQYYVFRLVDSVITGRDVAGSSRG